MTPVLLFFPTVLWGLGIAEFVLQLLSHGPSQHTLGWSVLVSFLMFFLAAVRNRGSASCFRRQWRIWRAGPGLFKCLTGVTLLLLALAGWESLHPPHLPQEFDAINYHMGLMRQHLLSGSLRHLSWSAADLWPMPVQFGYSSFWFAFKYFHRIPQFLAALWCFGHLLFLGLHFQGDQPLSGKWRGWIPGLAFFGAHGVMIQLGTAMLDLTNLYFMTAFLVGIVQLFSGNPGSQKKQGWCWISLHLALLLCCKAFSLLQCAPALAAALLFALWKNPRELVRHRRVLARIAFLCLALSAVLLLRTWSIGIHRAGTPFFPFGTCVLSSAPGCQGRAGDIIRESAKMQIETRFQYGDGRSGIAFLKHFWRVAVPSQGVNNEFDYPLGLPWLLSCLFLFWTLFFQPRCSGASRTLLFAAVTIWLLWWFGSQQSRWLYPTMSLVWLGTIEAQKKVRPRILLGVLLVSAAFSLVSEIRAFRGCLFRSAASISAMQSSRVQWDARSGLPRTLGTLYIDQALPDHAPASRYWILR